MNREDLPPDAFCRNTVLRYLRCCPFRAPTSGMTPSHMTAACRAVRPFSRSQWRRPRSASAWLARSSAVQNIV
eukprot:scaffold1397_cov254-Pinguiococcus_pyrenoidosus.AAC.28